LKQVVWRAVLLEDHNDVFEAGYLPMSYCRREDEQQAQKGDMQTDLHLDSPCFNRAVLQFSQLDCLRKLRHVIVDPSIRMASSSNRQ